MFVYLLLCGKMRRKKHFIAFSPFSIVDQSTDGIGSFRRPDLLSHQPSRLPLEKVDQCELSVLCDKALCLASSINPA